MAPDPKECRLESVDPRCRALEVHRALQNDLQLLPEKTKQRSVT